MKIAVSAESNDLKQNVSPVFGRCPGFIIAEIEESQVKEHFFIPNPAMQAGMGAGIAAAQEIAKQGAKAIISGNIGPNAFSVLKQSGIQVFQFYSGSIETALKQFAEGKLTEINASTAGGHFGMRKGPGRGRGFGRGPRMQ